MKKHIPESLRGLANIFAEYAPLYVVGGAVRNSLLNLPINDFDIAGKLTVDKVQEILEGTSYQVSAIYKRTGTLVIKQGKQTFEYTTFRQDSYPLASGKHTPLKCVFTEDMQIDANRRDFTCNALYYDILADKIIDFVGGIADIHNKVLRTVREPALTLSEDALRIMRLARFMVQLGFTVETATFEAAKRYAYQLQDISVERIKDELVAIFEGIFKYDSKSLGIKASDGIRFLVDIGAMAHIIPEVEDMIDFPQNQKYHVFDVYNHSLKAMDELPPRLMMAGLLHDIAKPVMQKEFGNMYMHEVKGAEMVTQIMTRLKFPKKDVERTAHLVAIHMFDVAGVARKSKCRVFIADNIDYFEDFVALRRADGVATNPDSYDDSVVQKLMQLKDEMYCKGLPMTIADLLVSGTDLIELGYQGKEIGEILGKIRLWMLQNGKVVSREEIINNLQNKKF